MWATPRHSNLYPISSPRCIGHWRRVTWLITGFALLAFLGLAAPDPAQAQSQDLKQRVDRLQQELSTLQRRVYGGTSQPSTGGTTAADINKPQAARLALQLSQLESQLRIMTGQIEEVTFRMDRLSKRMDGLVSDVDRRLQRLEQNAATAQGAPQQQLPGQPLPQVASQTPALPPTELQPGQAQQPPQQGQNFDSGPKVIGQVPAATLEELRQQAIEPGEAVPNTAAPSGGTQAAALQGQTPKEQYDQAFRLLSQANYSGAETALAAFLQQNPDDPLAGNAKYWMGETFYVRGQYREAAVTFAEGYQQYPNSSKAPDNLLKLAKSLSALGQTADACGTVDELLKRYPDAAATVIQQGKSERRRLACP